MSCPFSKGGTGRPVGRDGQRTGYPFSFSSPAAQKYSQEGHLTLDMMRVIMGEEKKSDLDRVTFTSDTLRKYFLKLYAPADAGNHHQAAGGMAEKASERPGTMKGAAYEGYFSP